MKILFKGDYIDFEAPIQMTENQRKKFISFMQTEFGKITEQEVQEKVKEISPRGESVIKHWTDEDLSQLMDGTLSNTDLSIKLERSEMGILMKRGSFVTEFVAWAKRKGYTSKGDLSKIKEYRLELKK